MPDDYGYEIDVPTDKIQEAKEYAKQTTPWSGDPMKPYFESDPVKAEIDQVQRIGDEIVALRQELLNYVQITGNQYNVNICERLNILINNLVTTNSLLEGKAKKKKRNKNKAK